MGLILFIKWYAVKSIPGTGVLLSASTPCIAGCMLRQFRTITDIDGQWIGHIFMSTPTCFPGGHPCIQVLTDEAIAFITKSKHQWNTHTTLTTCLNMSTKQALRLLSAAQRHHDKYKNRNKIITKAIIKYDNNNDNYTVIIARSVHKHTITVFWPHSLRA